MVEPPKPRLTITGCWRKVLRQVRPHADRRTADEEHAVVGGRLFPVGRAKASSSLCQRACGGDVGGRGRDCAALAAAVCAGDGEPPACTRARERRGGQLFHRHHGIQTSFDRKALATFLADASANGNGSSKHLLDQRALEQHRPGRPALARHTALGFEADRQRRHGAHLGFRRRQPDARARGRARRASAARRREAAPTAAATCPRLRGSRRRAAARAGGSSGRRSRASTRRPCRPTARPRIAPPARCAAAAARFRPTTTATTAANAPAAAAPRHSARLRSQPPLCAGGGGRRRFALAHDGLPAACSASIRLRMRVQTAGSGVTAGCSSAMLASRPCQTSAAARTGACSRAMASKRRRAPPRSVPSAWLAASSSSSSGMGGEVHAAAFMRIASCRCAAFRARAESMS